MYHIISILLQTQWFNDMPDDEYQKIAKDADPNITIWFLLIVVGWLAWKVLTKDKN